MEKTTNLKTGAGCLPSIVTFDNSPRSSTSTHRKWFSPLARHMLSFNVHLLTLPFVPFSRHPGTETKKNLGRFARIFRNENKAFVPSYYRLNDMMLPSSGSCSSVREAQGWETGSRWGCKLVKMGFQLFGSSDLEKILGNWEKRHAKCYEIKGWLTKFEMSSQFIGI